MYKKDFSILGNNPGFHYLDTAASALVPDVVIDAVNTYYKTYPVNVHRGLYDLSEKATIAFEEARRTVSRFIGADATEISFSGGTTAGLNMVAYALESRVKRGDNIVVSLFEHHANLIPWQQLCKRTGAELRVIGFDVDASKLIDTKSRVLACSMMSNVTGEQLPIAQWVHLAKSVGAVTVIDAAQAVVHGPLNVREIGCDVLAFSGHKLYGPTGVGVVYVAKHIDLPPSIFGGHMVQTVSEQEATWAETPARYEAGTPPIAGVIGLAAAARYLQSIGWSKIVEHESNIAHYAHEMVGQVATVLSKKGSPVLAFSVEGVHAHDVAQVLGDHGIAIRAGMHCAEPFVAALGYQAVARASIGIYTTKETIDALVAGIRKVKELFA